MFKYIKREVKDMLETFGFTMTFICLAFFVIMGGAVIGVWTNVILNYGSNSVITTETTQTETKVRYKIWCDDDGPYWTDSYVIDQNTVKFNERGTNYICTDFIIKEIQY